MPMWRVGGERGIERERKAAGGQEGKAEAEAAETEIKRATGRGTGPRIRDQARPENERDCVRPGLWSSPTSPLMLLPLAPVYRLPQLISKVRTFPIHTICLPLPTGLGALAKEVGAGSRVDLD